MADNEHIAEVAALAATHTVLPDDDDVLDGNLSSGGSSIPSTINRMIDTLTVESVTKKIIPPWWSKHRDRRLRIISRNNDYIGIGLYNVITKVTGILPSIVPPKDPTEQLNIAAMTSTRLLQNSWLKEVPGMLFDVNSQDNGGFFEIIGGGGSSWKPLPPVEFDGFSLPAVGLKAIDSQRVTRTGNPKWPIQVEWNDGKTYVMHHSRVIDFTQLPSTDPNMNGVGYCAVSRVINSMVQGGELDQMLIDILSTGLTGEIVLASPFSSDELEAAYKKADAKANDPTESNMQRYVFVGVENFEGNMQVVRIPLRRIPEGMTKADTVALLMQMIAAAVSIDLREIWPAPLSGNAKADANEHGKKTRSKFIREWTLYMKQQLSFKFAPLGTNATFDFIDPSEIIEVMEGRKMLSEIHKTELENGTIDIETALRQLSEFNYLEDGDIAKILENQTASLPLESQPVSSARVNNLFVPNVQRSKDVVVKQDEDAYIRELTGLIDEYRSGALDEDDFMVAVSTFNRTQVIDAYKTGSQKDFSQFSEEDFETLETYLDFLDVRVVALKDFVADIDDDDEVLLANRINKWENTVERVLYGSMLMQENQDQLLMWVRDPIKDSCSDCIGFDGQIKTIREWRDTGLAPRSPGLACSGILCGCTYLTV